MRVYKKRISGATRERERREIARNWSTRACVQSGRRGRVRRRRRRSSVWINFGAERETLDLPAGQVLCAHLAEGEVICRYTAQWEKQTRAYRYVYIHASIDFLEDSSFHWRNYLPTYIMRERYIWLLCRRIGERVRGFVRVLDYRDAATAARSAALYAPRKGSYFRRFSPGFILIYIL